MADWNELYKPRDARNSVMDGSGGDFKLPLAIARRQEVVDNQIITRHVATPYFPCSTERRELSKVLLIM